MEINTPKLNTFEYLREKHYGKVNLVETPVYVAFYFTQHLHLFAFAIEPRQKKLNVYKAS